MRWSHATKQESVEEVIIDPEWGAFGDNGCIDFIKSDYDREVKDIWWFFTQFVFTCLLLLRWTLLRSYPQASPMKNISAENTSANYYAESCLTFASGKFIFNTGERLSLMILIFMQEMLCKPHCRSFDGLRKSGLYISLGLDRNRNWERFRIAKGGKFKKNLWKSLWNRFDGWGWSSCNEVNLVGNFFHKTLELQFFFLPGILDMPLLYLHTGAPYWLAYRCPFS